MSTKQSNGADDVPQFFRLNIEVADLPAAIGFYRSCGFVELETWQLWSRPRWVLGRA